MSQDQPSKADNDVWTIGKLINWTHQYLTDSGSTSARLDTEVLLAEVLGCQRIMLYTRFDEDPGDAVRTNFRELVKQRAAGCPVAYLVGHKEFFSLKFQVTTDTLIPRPDTEEAVQVVLDLVKGEQVQPNRIADIGTGSGVLAITLATELPETQFLATDISAAALQVATSNAQAHAVADRVQFRAGDLCEPLQGEMVDLLVSNPPYVSTAELEQSSCEVKDYEPHQALVSGPTGMEIYERLVPEAITCLTPAGWLVLETSPMLADSLKTLLTQHAFKNVTVRQDLAGHPRIVYGQR
ncbi:MAG: protein-(glutamine-N5) methyltransferase, release factor-specific [Planctomycetaceae bacterium]|nr:protein-(glutamine-N5) methyltransferase, release factor-specific [Planctomycetaceae bacterium]|tara:strand:- start:17423 stop:18310 length:888 start_codon:yes stop_codon:yes gene_type:complete